MLYKYFELTAWGSQREKVARVKDRFSGLLLNGIVCVSLFRGPERKLDALASLALGIARDF